MSAEASRDCLKRGHAARHAGRPAEALEHYRAALDEEPQDAEANSVYGLMLLQLGRAEEAEAPLRKALDIAPSHAALRANLAQWLAQQERLDEAVALIESIVADEPAHWWAWERLGDLKIRRQEFHDAASHFARASELVPDNPSILFKQARACFDDGRAGESEKILGRAARLTPNHAAILRLYADLQEARADWNALGQTANTWTAVHPKDHRAWLALAKAQWETGWLRQAMQSFRTGLELGGRTAEGLATYGRLCLSALEYEQAAAALDEAEKLDAASGPVLSAKAVLLMFRGDYDEAQSCARRALKADRNGAAAWKVLVQLTGGRLPRTDVAALRRLAQAEDRQPADRATAAFALADCLDAQDDAPAAMAAYDLANRLSHEHGRASGIAYDPAIRRAQVDELITLFERVPAPASDDSVPRPVFIVGMPRSGTTLIESVIAAHSAVFACGERMAMRWILQDYLARARQGRPSEIPETTWQEWRDYYRKEIPDVGGATVVTDKNPWNFDAIALILRLFPGARIVHVRRSPIETGFSIYRNQFARVVSYAHRLEDIGHYYGGYARLMDHWARIAGERFTTVRYEDFVREFDKAGPALLAACGLAWEPACANFWENRRAIGTMSTMQARRPPEERSDRAGRYAAELEPLVTALAAAGVDPQTGDWTPDRARKT